MDRKWRLTRYGVCVGTVLLAVVTAHHIAGDADNSGLIMGTMAFIAGVIGEYFAANAAINNQKSKNFRPEIQGEK